MDRATAIEILQNSPMPKDMTLEQYAATKIALADMQKQVPMKLIDNYVCWECPTCGMHFVCEKEVKYCEDCGQAILWENEVDQQ